MTSVKTFSAPAAVSASSCKVASHNATQGEGEAKPWRVEGARPGDSPASGKVRPQRPPGGWFWWVLLLMLAINWLLSSALFGPPASTTVSYTCPPASAVYDHVLLGAFSLGAGGCPLPPTCDSPRIRAVMCG